MAPAGGLRDRGVELSREGSEPLVDDRGWMRALDRLDAGDREGALEMLERAGDAEGLDGQVASLLRETLEGREPGEAARDADAGATADGLAGSVRDTLLACGRAIQALAAGRTEALTEEAARAESVLPPDWLWLRLRVASLHQALYRFTGAVAARDTATTLARSAADRTDRPPMAVLARGILASVSLLTGRFHETLEVCEAGIELAVATGLSDHRFVAMSHQFRGYVQFEWNRMDEARADLERAWELAGPSGRGVRSGVARILAALHAESGDESTAEQWARELEDIVAEPMTLRNREWLAAVRIRQGAGRAGDLRRVDAWRRRYAYDAEELRALHPSHVPARLHELEHLLTVLEATSQWEQIPDLADLTRSGSRGDRLWFRVRASSAEAVALLRMGRTDAARALWEEALLEGEAGGFVRAFVAGSPARMELLAWAAEDSRTAEAAARVLDAAGTSIASPRLTAKQTQVLSLVAKGLRNRDVGEALGISEATVRTHLRAVFDRLDVGSRTEAVAVGRREGLLE